VFKLELNGVRELKEAFERIKLDMGEALAAGLLAGTMVVLYDTKVKAPVLSGTLMRSYFVTTPSGETIVPPEPDGAGEVALVPMEASKNALAELARKMRTTGRGEVWVATNTIYAAIQEFRYTPHLRPALDENVQNVHAEAKKAIQWAIITASRNAGRAGI